MFNDILNPENNTDLIVDRHINVKKGRTVISDIKGILFSERVDKSLQKGSSDECNYLDIRSNMYSDGLLQLVDFMVWVQTHEIFMNETYINFNESAIDVMEDVSSELRNIERRRSDLEQIAISTQNLKVARYTLLATLGAVFTSFVAIIVNFF